MAFGVAERPRLASFAKAFESPPCARRRNVNRSGGPERMSESIQISSDAYGTSNSTTELTACCNAILLYGLCQLDRSTVRGMEELRMSYQFDADEIAHSM